jgi:hypothetical protein
LVSSPSSCSTAIAPRHGHAGEWEQSHGSLRMGISSAFPIGRS